MSVLLTPKLIAELAEKYEFGTPMEKRRAFDKLRGHGEEALRLIERLSHAKVEAEKSKATPGSDSMDWLRDILNKGRA